MQIGDGSLAAQRVRTFALPLAYLAWAWHAMPVEAHQAGNTTLCHWWAVAYALILHCLICEWWRLRHTKGTVAAFADWPWCALLLLVAFPASLAVMVLVACSLATWQAVRIAPSLK